MGATVAGMVAPGLSVAIVDLTDGEPTPAGTRETRLAEADAAARCSASASAGPRPAEPAAVRHRGGSRRAGRGGSGAAAANRVRAVPASTRIRTTSRRRRSSRPRGSGPSSPRPRWRVSRTTRPRLYRYMAVHLRLVREPSFVVDVSEDLPVKLEALAMYRSQFSANPANTGLIEMMEACCAHVGRDDRDSRRGALLLRRAGRHPLGRELV
jgi:N-acetylglucosamine malate deacetylase 1